MIWEKVSGVLVEMWMYAFGSYCIVLYGGGIRMMILGVVACVHVYN